MAETKYAEDRIAELRAIHRQAPENMNDVLMLMKKELDIFVDIVPGYKIKEHKITQEASKQVQAVQKNEQTILTLYRKYVDYLLKSSKSRVTVVANEAYLSMCRLLTAAAYFNFASNIIQTVVEGTCSRTANVANGCVAALEELYEIDGTGEATLKAVSCVTNLIKQKRHLVNPQLIGSFIHLRLTSVDIHKETVKEKESARITKKKTKEEVIIEKELVTSQAVQSKEDRKKTQTALLQRLVAAYLRVIEAAQGANGVRQARLLAPTMEGLNKFALLMDIELLQLLITAVKDILNAPNSTPMTTLNGVMTLAILTNAADQATAKVNVAGDIYVHSAVAVDMSEAYDHLYRVIPDVLSVPTAADLTSLSRERAMAQKDAIKTSNVDVANFDTMSMATSAATTANIQHEYINLAAERNRRVTLLLRALQLLLMKPQSIPIPRLAAFAKRLSTYSIHQPPHIAMALISFVRGLSQKRSTLVDMIAQSPALVAGPGKYNPNTNSPDHAFAQNSVMWEWCLCNDSYHPTLRTFTTVVQKTALMAQDPLMKKPPGLTTSMLNSVNRQLTSQPEDILKMHDTSLGTFNPPPAEPQSKKRKLLDSASSNGGDNRGEEGEDDDVDGCCIDD
jgi:nucleolar complex protein 3